jgi:hypothetical protein
MQERKQFSHRKPASTKSNPEPSADTTGASDKQEQAHTHRNPARPTRLANKALRSVAHVCRPGRPPSSPPHKSTAFKCQARESTESGFWRWARSELRIPNWSS